MKEQESDWLSAAELQKTTGEPSSQRANQTTDLYSLSLFQYKMSTKNPIAVVDDDADDRALIKDAFLENNPNKTFILLENGDQLIELLKTMPEPEFPSLILLDLNMPGKDGREALQEIKKDPRLHHIPIVVFSTSSLDKDRIISYGLGANCFLTKPSSYQEMIDFADAIVKLWIP